MKVALVLLCALFGTTIAQTPVGPVDWSNVTPIWQTPGFLENFPILRWIIARNPDGNNGFILGGRPAMEQQFPWNIGLIFDMEGSGRDGFCGGTLVTPQWVLTAAHCAYLSTSGIAIAGSNNIMNSNNLNQQRVTFSMVQIIPLWNPDQFEHDMALVRLDTPFTLNDQIQVARLPTSRQATASFVNQRSYVAGWGSVAPWVSPMMSFIRTQVMGRFACVLAYPALVGPANICTSGSGPSPCQGDSGVGISVQEADSEKTVIGVLSFGSALGCTSSRATVYTLIGPYLSWISMVTDAQIRL